MRLPALVNDVVESDERANRVEFAGLPGGHRAGGLRGMGEVCRVVSAARAATPIANHERQNQSESKKCGSVKVVPSARISTMKDHLGPPTGACETSTVGCFKWLTVRALRCRKKSTWRHVHRTSASFPSGAKVGGGKPAARLRGADLGVRDRLPNDGRQGQPTLHPTRSIWLPAISMGASLTGIERHETLSSQA